MRRAEEWSGVPLRWMLWRVFYATCVAILAGVFIAVAVVTLRHYSDTPPVVNVELVWPS